MRRPLAASLALAITLTATTAHADPPPRRSTGLVAGGGVMVGVGIAAFIVGTAALLLGGLASGAGGGDATNVIVGLPLHFGGAGLVIGGSVMIHVGNQPAVRAEIPGPWLTATAPRAWDGPRPLVGVRF